MQAQYDAFCYLKEYEMLFVDPTAGAGHSVEIRNGAAVRVLEATFAVAPGASTAANMDTATCELNGALTLQNNALSEVTHVTVSVNLEPGGHSPRGYDVSLVPGGRTVVPIAWEGKFDYGRTYTAFVAVQMATPGDVRVMAQSRALRLTLK